jgi:hypothetical protein
MDQMNRWVLLVKNRRGKDIVGYDERILELQKEAPERRKTAGRVKIREPFFAPHSKGSVLYVVSNRQTCC